MTIQRTGAAPAADRQSRYIAALEEHFASLREEGAFGLPGPGSDSLEGWFLGPKAENVELLKSLVCAALDAHAEDRREFHPEDPEIITPAVKQSAPYKQAIEALRTDVEGLLGLLRQSVPFFSMRYQGHMNWETTLPGIIGYFAAMLYNQNNVAVEASPVTTKLEMEVGEDLCRLVGFDVLPAAERDGAPAPGGVVPWGHITCDGSVNRILDIRSRRSPTAVRRRGAEVAEVNIKDCCGRGG